MKFVLGSNSESIIRIMLEMGYGDFKVVSAVIDENTICVNDPEDLTLSLANKKADAIAGLFNEPAIIITAAQVVVFNGQIRKKPVSQEEARDFLMSYSWRSAQTVTSVVVTNTLTGLRYEGTDLALIYFHGFSREWVEYYVQTGEPLHRTGGFNYRHYLVRPFVNRIEGETESIEGLPRQLTETLIQQAQECIRPVS